MVEGKYNRLSPIWRNQAVSSGTNDVLQIFEAVKQFLPDEMIIDFQQTNPLLQEAILKNDIYPFLNEIAPEKCYFGTYEEEETEIGFWDFPDDIEDEFDNVDDIEEEY